MKREFLEELKLDKETVDKLWLNMAKLLRLLQRKGTL